MSPGVVLIGLPGLAEKVEGFLSEMLAGPGAVRATLVKYLG